MKIPVYDAHNHLQDARLDAHRGRVLGELEKIGLSGAVVNGTREEDWSKVLKVVRARRAFIPSIGLHPWHVAGRSAGWEERMQRLLDEHGCAVGEIGLDRWVRNFDFAAQQEVFEAQVRMAAERNVPMTVHCLKAWGALLETLQRCALPEAGFLLHSYGGPAEMVGAFVELGGYFSFSGYFAHDRKARQREVFRQIPLERIVIETDAPDMLPPKELIEFPIPATGEVAPNNPANIRAIYEYFAGLRGVELGELAEIVAGNYRRLFGRLGLG